MSKYMENKKVHKLKLDKSLMYYRPYTECKMQNKTSAAYKVTNKWDKVTCVRCLAKRGKK